MLSVFGTLKNIPWFGTEGKTGGEWWRAGSFPWVKKDFGSSSRLLVTRALGSRRLLRNDHFFTLLLGVTHSC